MSVYGLGRLGLPLASVLARAGHDVTGIDPDTERVRRLRSGWVPELDDLDTTGIGFLTEAFAADMSFVVVPTPSVDTGDRRGGFDPVYVEAALRNIGRVNDEGHIAVVVSTVSPGTCDRLMWAFPKLQIVYNPTFIALGQVVEGLIFPNLLLIGGALLDPVLAVQEVWESVFERFGWDEPDLMIHLSDYVEVELVKLSLNAALATKISLANSLGQLFEAWGADPAAVELVGRDPRIGAAYFSPGGPITGPCLPRDNAALRFAGIEKGVDLPLSVATDRVNHSVLENLRYRVLTHQPKSVGVLGMSYKYGLDVDTAAVGPWVCNAFRPSGIECLAYDDVLGGDPVESVLGCDVVVVTQREYRARVDGHPKVVEVWA